MITVFALNTPWMVIGFWNAVIGFSLLHFKRDWLPIEEACAELTASFVLADLGIAHHPRPDHAAYLLAGDAAAVRHGRGDGQGGLGKPGSCAEFVKQTYRRF